MEFHFTGQTHEVVLILNKDSVNGVIPTPLTKTLEELGLSHRRFAYIYPVNPILRTIYKIIRWIFPYNSRIVNWAKNWRCEWGIYFPKGGVISGFKSREEAVLKENELALHKIWTETVRI